MYLPQKYISFKSIRYIYILQECINFEIKTENKLCNFTALYHSHSQSQDTFQSFIDKLRFNSDAIAAKNPYLIGCEW